MKEPEPNSSGPPRSDSVEQVIDLELRLCLEEGSASPHGYIRDRCGNEQDFRGWLGLLGLLEATTAFTPPCGRGASSRTVATTAAGRRGGDRGTGPSPDTLRHSTDESVTAPSAIRPTGTSEPFFRDMIRLIEDGRVKRLTISHGPEEG